jgi:CheY-like chemotaxis protein
MEQYSFTLMSDGEHAFESGCWLNNPKRKSDVMNNGYRIIWLEDQRNSIADLTEYLQVQGDFSITIFERSTDALTALLEEDPDLFIVDLLLNDEGDGLSIAKTARVMKPSIPIVAVTEYLPIFCSQIALALTERRFPFAAIWDKNSLEQLEAKEKFVEELRLLCQPEYAEKPYAFAATLEKYSLDLLEAKKRFVEELHLLCQPEYHVGEVTKMEDDYAQVTLRTPKGDEYTRFFDTEFLEACGIGKAGEGIELVFWKTADGKSGEVHMRLTKRTAGEDTVAKAKEIISKVDLEKIRGKFGAQVDDS